MKKILSPLVFLLSFYSFAQTIEGFVKNEKNELIIGAHIHNTANHNATITDTNGKFTLENVEEGTQLFISHLGYKSVEITVDSSANKTLEIILTEDFLNLEEVLVTGTHIPSFGKDLSIPISSLTYKEIARNNTNGTAALLEQIPGVYADASAGEVFTRVYTRGVSISAEDDLGWYYVGLHEDGMPVTAVQFASFAPDLFHRIDGSVGKVESVRGGSASIVGVNTPGGVFNFISSPISKVFKGNLSLNTGVHYNDNIYNKIDATVSGPISDKFGYQIALSHRYDEGSRDVPYTLNKGGQARIKLNYTTNKSQLEFYGKYLNDHVNRFTGVAAENWNDPRAAFDQNFKTTTQLLPNSSASIPDGTGGYYEFDPSNGIHTKDIVAGLIFKTDLSDTWTLTNNFKYSSKSANWQTSLSNAILPLDSFLPYFISGAQFPVGQVIFRDPNSTTEIARVDNSGIFGDPPSFNYLTDGTLPNDAILGVAAWYKDDKNEEFMNQLSVNGTMDNHKISAGVFLSQSNVEALTRASFAYATYSTLPSSLTATVENPGFDISYLSDEHGYSNYGGLFYEKGEAKVNQAHLFFQDQWEVSDQWIIDFGFRYNHINHDGSKDRSAPLEKDGGYDGDPQTAYDNGILISTGTVDEFNYNYNNLSYSIGANHKINEKTNLFARVSVGEKAPELDYYFSNFSNVPINEKGPTQEILQIETGLKYSSDDFTLIPTLFYSNLSNVGFSTFVFDEDTNEIFYTPMQFNSTETFGLEFESVYHPTTNFKVIGNFTFQNAKALDFTVYDANGTIDTDDDEIIAYDGNKLPFNPSIMLDITPEYYFKKTTVYAHWRYMGEREGNIANSFQLPAYSLFNLGASYQILSNLNAGIHVKNAFNSEGLMNFYGPNSFGASKDDATQEYIDNNPNGTFIVTPVQARMIHLTLNYAF